MVITEQLDATHFKGTVKSKVCPAVTQFGGEIEVLALDAATRRLQLLGKGADKSGSSATMNLSAQVEPGDTPHSSVLVGAATITVSGKLAQFGSRGRPACQPKPLPRCGPPCRWPPITRQPRRPWPRASWVRWVW